MSSAMSLCLPLAVLLRNRTLSKLSVHMSQDYETVVPRHELRRGVRSQKSVLRFPRHRLPY
jgi:hypothetical protein